MHAFVDTWPSAHTGEEIELGLATKNDLKPILVWLRNEFRPHRYGLYGNKQVLRQCVKNGDTLVIREGHKVIGFSALIRDQIALFEIKPSQRRKGHGRELIKATMELAHERGLSHLSLEYDPFSYAFWAAQGFNCSQWRAYIVLRPIAPT